MCNVLGQFTKQKILRTKLSGWEIYEQSFIYCLWYKSSIVCEQTINKSRIANKIKYNNTDAISNAMQSVSN
jgi:hypothetical protein